jgi:uncharacterized protein (DUF1330 family)
MTSTFFPRNVSELKKIRAIAAGQTDHPVLMLNLNKYKDLAGYPGGELYQSYMPALDQLLPHVGARILWRSNVFGQVVGEQEIHEVIAAWYPTHQAFLDLPNSPGAEENYRLRDLCVEYAVIHRCSGACASLSLEKCYTLA